MMKQSEKPLHPADCATLIRPTVLHEAALNGNAAMIRLLLERGANPGLANDEGGLPVDLARSKGHAEAERLLEMFLTNR